jgi:hypothetical protein
MIGGMKAPSEIAVQHGFKSVEHLRAESKALPGHDGDQRLSYLAHSPLGYWFVWDSPLDERQAGKQAQ